jgi:uncharacterized damage-inducible protein DinB
MLTIADMLEELEQEAQATRRVLERVPADRLGWRPHAKSMTLGELGMHVAMLPGALAGVATGTGFDVNTEIPRPTAASTVELLETLGRSVAEAKALLGEMDEAFLASSWTMRDGEREIWSIPRRAFLRSVLFNHWYHHRGQLTVYLRLTGALVPAVYGDSADESSLRAE